MPVDVPKTLSIPGAVKPFDGKLDAPDVAPFEGVVDEEKGGIARRAADVGISALKGAIGVPEAAVGIADIATGGRAGKAAEAIGFRPKAAKDFLDEQLSPEQQYANKQVSEAKGFLPTVGAAVRYPSTIGHAVVESVPLMMGGGVISGALRRAGLATPVVAGAVGEGVVSAGQNAEQVRQEAPTGLLDNKATAAMVASGVGTGAFSLLGGKLAQKLKIADIDTMLASGKLAAPAGASTKGFLRRMAEGAISEGAFEELPQSLQEQLWQNYASGRPIMEGVAEAGAMGMLAGGVMGGGANALIKPEGPVTQAAAIAQASGAGVKVESAQAATQAPEPLAKEAKTGASPASAATPPERPMMLPLSQEGAEKRAAMLDRQGRPSRVIPHPERDGRFAVIDDEYGTATSDEGRISALVKEAGTIIDRVPEGSKTVSKGVASRLTEIDAELADLRQAEAERKAPKKPTGQGVEIKKPAGSEIPTEQRVKAAMEKQPFERTAMEMLLIRQAPSNIITPGDKAAPAEPKSIIVPEPSRARGKRAVDEAAHEAATSPHNDRSEPTPDQIEAGNYKKGPMNVGGLAISIENPQDSVRRSKPDAPVKWEQKMNDHYGYIKGVPARAPDKQHVDVFVKPGTTEDHAGAAYVVDQNHGNGKFDEPKIMMGYASQDEARAAYLSNYQAGWESHIRGITELTHDELKAKLDDPAGFLKPQGEAQQQAEPETKAAEPETTPAKTETPAKAEKFPGHISDLIVERGGDPAKVTLIATRAEFRDFQSRYGPPNQIPNADGTPKFGAGDVLFVDDDQNGVPVGVALRDTIQDWGNTETLAPAARAVTDAPDTIGGKPVAGIPLPKLRKMAGKGPARIRAIAQAEIDRREEGRREARAAAEHAEAQKNTPSRRFLRLVVELGGVKSTHATDIVGEKAGVKLGGMAARVFRKNGQGLDYLATQLHERNWLTDADYNDVDGGVQRVRDMLRDAIEGRLEPVTVADIDRKMERERAEREAEEQDKADAAVVVASLEDQGKLSSGQVTDDELDQLFGPESRPADKGPAARGQEENARDGKENARAEEPAEAAKSTEVKTPTTSTDTPAQAGVYVSGPLKLTGQTEQEIAAEEAKRKRSEEEKAASEKAAENKRKADAERDTFTLSGSDRAADAAAAQGQEDIFSQPANTLSAADLLRAAADKMDGATPVAENAEKLPDDFGKKNKLFTQSDADAARALLKKKLGNINIGIDPEVMQAGIQLAGYYIEGGARSFIDYTAKMVADLGEAVRPYLKSWYAAVYYQPGDHTDGMEEPSMIKEAKEPGQMTREEFAAIATVTRTGNDMRVSVPGKESVLIPGTASKEKALTDAHKFYAQMHAIPTIDEAKAAPAESPIVKVYPSVEGTEIHVIKNYQGYAVNMMDTDAGKYMPVLRMFSGEDALDKATAYAESIQKKADPESGGIIQPGANDATSSRNPEPDRADSADAPPVGAVSVLDGPGAIDEAEGITGSEALQAGFFDEGDRSLPVAGAAAGGKRRDQPVHSENGEFGPAPSVPGTDNDQRGVDSSDAGIPFESVAATAVEKAAENSADIVRKRAAQHAAESIAVTPRDLSNIRETLPFLLPAQQEDVKFAEDRFAAEGGYGAMFTNGTGTGKTFTGLGIVKRFARQGKNNIVILAPTDKVLTDWMSSAKNLNLDITQLSGIDDNGTGIVATTYANFGTNRTLADRKWDLVVTDESHYLLSNMQGFNQPTEALSTLRAITMHPDGAYRRARMILRELDDRTNDARAKLSAAEKMNPHNVDPMVRADYERLRQEFDDKAKPLHAQVKNATPDQRSRVVFLSATPFPYVKTVDYAHGYLFDYKEGQTSDETSRGYNGGADLERFYMLHFGYRMRYNKLTAPDAEVNTGLMERQFNTWLKKRGALSGRMLDVTADYDRKFVLVKSAAGEKIDSGLEWLREKANADKNGKLGWRDMETAVAKRFDYLSRLFLLEAIKANDAIPHIRAHLALGRKVVVFHDYKKGGGFHPFRLPKNFSTVGENGGSRNLSSLVAEFEAARPDLINMPFDTMRAPIDAIFKAFPDVLIFNGDVPKAQRRRNVDIFQSDESGRNLILVQSAAGKEGISLHDTTGKFQRTMINLGLPGQPVTAIQQEGRTMRTGVVSDAIYRYFNTGTFFERGAFAHKIASRSSTAENLALGESARALRDAFISAFESSGSYPASAEDGKGTKETDRAALSSISEFDRAKTFYFGQAKKTSRTKAAEGVDYFATPEPLASKMVEWADIKTGEDVLEPSAGHGAIARFFPTDTNNTAVEPSQELASRVALVFDGTIKNERFEDLHIVNKYDVIVMNPPFGSGGRTAIDHLDKAAGHLRDGGRIVALIPTGPAADAKFEKWLYDAEAAKNGYTNAASIYLAADIALPSVTFERAGTTVKARIVILEKAIDPKQAGRIRQVSRDYSDATTIGEFFDAIENSTIPARQEVAPPPQTDADALLSGRDGKLPEQQPTGTTGGTPESPKYVTDAPEIAYITKKGKELKGVIAKGITKEQAKAIDKYTWAKDGGFFIRMQYVERPGAARMSRSGLTPEDTRATAALKLLGGNDALFQYPRSDKKSLADIVSDVRPKFTVTDVTEATPDKPPKISKIFEIRDSNSNMAEVTQTTDGVVWVNIHGWEQGTAGSAIYSMVANYAYNNGLVFEGDPNGLSDVAMRRRLENMLSSALKFGTTRHLRPHENQLQGDPKIGISALSWEDGNDTFNLRQMMAAAYHNLRSLFPEIDNVTYDFDRHIFVENGKIIGEKRFVELSQSLGAREARAGRATLKRGALFNTLVREQSSEGWRRILGAALRQSGNELDRPLRDSFYSRNPALAGFSASGHTVDSLRAELADRLGVPADKLGITAVNSWSDLPESLVEQVLNSNAYDIQGAFDPESGQVYLVANNIRKGSALAVYLHEVGVHKGLRAFLGTEDFDKLGNTIRFWSSQEGTEEARLAKIAAARIPAGTDPAVATEELIAYFVEEATKAGHDIQSKGSIGDWMRDLVRAIVQAIKKLGGSLTDLKAGDVVALARGAAKVAVGRNLKTSPNILMSRAGSEQYQAATGVRAHVLRALKTFDTGTLAADEGVLNAWNKTVGTPELVARKNASFGKVFWEGQAFLNDTNRLISQSEAELPSWFKGQDILSRWFDRIRGKEVAQAEKAAEALLDGTLANHVYTDAELAARGLSAREIGMYDEARNSIDAILERTGVALISKIAPQYAPVAQRLIDVYKTDGVDAMRAFANADPASTEWPVVERSIERIAKLQRDGYFPLSRYGRYYVNVTEPRGETVEFRMYETEIMARAGAAALSKKYPAAYEVKRGTISQNTPDLFKGLTPESVELFAEITGMDQDEAMQKYLKEAVANRSTLKRMIHRKGTPGYSRDAVRVLADFITTNARYQSRLQHFDNLTQHAHDIQGGELRDYAINLVKYLRGDDGREEFQNTRAFLFFQYIGGNISSAMLNLTQVPLFGVPWLNQHVSLPAAGRLLKRAYPLALRDPKAVFGEVGDALRRAEEEGHTNPQNVYTTMAIGSGSKLARVRAFSGLLDAWAFLFSKAETLNRRVMFIAAYELAQTRGLTGDDAYQFAIGGVRDTQLIYNKGNRPVWARGIGAIPFTFKLFTIQALELIFAKLPPKQAAVLLAMMALGAGAEGLPFAEDLENLIDTLGQKLGYATNTKRFIADQLQASFQEWLGLSPQTAFMASEMVRKGVFANTPLASLGARVGMGRIIPGTESFLAGRSAGPTLADVAGPIGGFASNITQASELVGRGEFGRAAEKALPSGISNLIKGGRQLEAGEEVTPFGRRVAPVSTSEALLQASGVVPASVGRAREREFTVKQDEAYLKMVEDRIADKWASAIVSKEPDKVREAREDLKAHNERNPGGKIIITPSQIQSRVKNLRREGMQSAVKGVAKERRAEARRFLAEAQ